MKPVTTIQGIAAPLPLKDIDTDMIIPAQFLTSISREGYGANLFRRLRDSDPDFVLSQPKYANAKILITGSNFGCGSSREHAVWALKDGGFDVVIAPSFADIFYSNSAKNSLLLVTLPAVVIDSLMEKATAQAYELSIDLNKQILTAPEEEAISFEVDPFRKHCLLKGLDDFEYLLSHKSQISDYFKGREEVRFFKPVIL